MRGLGLDIAGHLGVDDLSLAVRVERHAAVLAELGLGELGPQSHFRYADLAQHLADLLERRRLVVVALGAEQGPDDAVRIFVGVFVDAVPDPVLACAYCAEGHHTGTTLGTLDDQRWTQ